MAFSSGNSKGPQADINVTPLVDVVLVLLIIFMVITPMLQEAEVTLPKAENAVKKDDKSSEPLIVSVEKDGALYLGNDPVNVDQLRAELTKVFEPRYDEYGQDVPPYDPEAVIWIKGDVEARYADVRVIMEICEELGAPKVGLQIDEKTTAKKVEG